MSVPPNDKFTSANLSFNLTISLSPLYLSFRKTKKSSMRKHYHSDKPNPDQPRHICYRCRKKRYEDRMLKIFAHPLITGNNPFWACKKTWGQDGCSDEVIKEFTMYNETGALHLVPTVQDIHNQTPRASKR